MHFYEKGGTEMRRSIISVLLVLILLVAVSAFAVEASEVTKITYEQAVETAGGEGGTLHFWCDACGKNEDWTAASVSNKKFTPGTGHAYVPSTSSLSDSTALNPSNFQTVNGKLCLYLKGDVLYTGTTRMFQLYTTTDDAIAAGADRSQLNLMGTGTIKSTGEMSSGTTALITATTNTSTKFNEFVMYGGTIDCSQGSNSSGATVFYANGTTSTAATRNDSFVMKGGTIKGGSSGGFGGTLYLKYTCDFEMTGGTIIGGTTTGQAGGVLYMSEYNSGLTHTFTMTGGTIKDGKVEHTVESKNAMGGNLFFEGIDVTISGDAKIQNGKAETSEADARGGNIYITGTCNLEISGTAEISGGHATTTKNSTSVASQGGNILTQSNVTTTISGNPVIKDGHTTVKNNSDCHGGNLYTFGTVTMSGGTIQDGYTYRTSNSSYTSAKNRGGNVYVAGKTFTMTGGVIEKTDESTLTNQCNRGGNVYVAADFVLNGADAVIRGGEATRGANVAVASGKTMTVSNGTISGGTSSYGRGIFVEGEVTLAGGSVENNRAHGIYILNRKATTIADGTETVATGKLTITNGFTGTVYLRANSDTKSDDTTTYEDSVAFVADNKLSSTLAVSDGYVAGGKVFAYYGGTYYPIVGSGTELVVAEAVIYDGESTVSIPETAQAAMSAQIGNQQYVKLFNAPNAELSLTQDVTVDFNGNNATVTRNGYTLTGMDSQTDDYTEDGAAKVAFSEIPTVNNEVELTVDKEGEPVTGTRKYLALANQDGTYSFHRYYLSMDKAGLRTSDNDGIKGPGIAFSAVFRGDEAVKNAITAYGVEFDVAGNKTAFAYSDAFVATERNEGKLLAVHGLMNETHQSTEVSAKAYIKVGEDTIYSTNAASNNLKALVETYAASYNSGDLATAFIAPYEAMIAKYGDAMRLLQWKIDKEVA